MENDYIDSIITIYEEILQAVKQDGYALNVIDVQTDELCLEAVKQSGWALQYVEEQTDELCL